MVIKRKSKDLGILIRCVKVLNFNYEWVNEEDIPVDLMDLILHFPHDVISFLRILGVTRKQRYQIAPAMRFHFYKLKEYRLYRRRFF